MKPPLILLAEDSLVPWCCATAVLEGPKADKAHRDVCEWNAERDQIRRGEPVSVHPREVLDPSRWPVSHD